MMRGSNPLSSTWTPRLFLAVILVSVATACDQSGRDADAGTPAGARRSQAESHLPWDTLLAIGRDSVPIRLETVAAGLEVPWDLVFLPDGRILFTERPGRIRVIENGVLRAAPWASLDVFGEDPALLPESGLMGVALHPRFAQNGHVYVMATVHRGGRGRAARLWDRVRRRIERLFGRMPEPQWHNRVYRLTDRAGYGTERQTIIDGLPASYYHAGGGLRFGPDSLLYLTIGDTFESPKAQDPLTRVGAVLRYHPDGAIPPDNPIAGSPVYAHGLRNTQGLTWDPVSGTMFGVDHGPSFLPHEDGRYGRDELNVIVAGGNYGWPVEAGTVSGARFRQPVAEWTPGIAPAAVAVYDGGLFSDWRGSLLVSGLRGRQLRRVVVVRDTATGEWEVTEEEVLLTGLGRIRLVRVAPDGAVYISTSNRDGRGAPAPQDDRILRIVPASNSAEGGSPGAR